MQNNLHPHLLLVKSKYLPNPNLNPIDQLEFVGSCPEIYEEKPFLMIFALENSSVISGEVENQVYTLL